MKSKNQIKRDYRQFVQAMLSPIEEFPAIISNEKKYLLKQESVEDLDIGCKFNLSDYAVVEGIMQNNQPVYWVEHRREKQLYSYTPDIVDYLSPTKTFPFTKQGFWQLAEHLGKLGVTPDLPTLWAFFHGDSATVGTATRYTALALDGELTYQNLYDPE